MPPTQPGRPILIASNRGPVSFVRDQDGRVQARRGSGGLVTALTGALQGGGGLWIASAMSEEDRAQAARRMEVMIGAASYSVRYLSFDRRTYGGYYDHVSNRVLWFLHHMLWELPRAPRFEGLASAWSAYRRVNDAFARALDEEAGSTAGRFLVQDYHLALVPGSLRRARPDARIAHFSHIPFVEPGYFRILPEPFRTELLAGMLGADVLGFQTRRWAKGFLASCRLMPGARVDGHRGTVSWDGREIRVRVYPVSIDPEALRSEADSSEVARARRRVERVRGDRRLVVRVDRAELSKNILRGLLAFERLLERQRHRRGRVVFAVLLNPSREGISEYRAYARECLETARRINDRFGRPGWEPIWLTHKDDYPLALAAYQLYDALLVNPVFDGMNLVAKEGPALNERGGVLILSENAGAFDELGAHALPVNPFDVEGTARALAAALDMDQAERRKRSQGLRSALTGNPIDRWVNGQLEDLDRVGTT